jgi:hypothetical protein
VNTTVRRRVARTCHECSWGRCRIIHSGETYLEHKSFPGAGDDAGWATSAGHPVRLAECSDCAIRYGRGELLRG